MRQLLTLFALFLALLIPVESVAGPFTVLPKRGSAWAGGWLTGWDYRKEFTVSRASGAVSNYPMKLYVGESASLNAPATITDCENTANWTAVKAAVSNVAGYDGNCIKIAGSEADGRATFQFVGGADWAEKRKISFWQKRDGTADTDGEVFFIDYFGNFVQYNFTMADNWTNVVIDTRTTPNSSSGTINWGSVYQIRFDCNHNGTNLYIDKVQRGFIEDVSCGGNVASTFNDLRFTTSDGKTTIPYWIESINGTTPAQSAVVWVNFDSIGTSDTTFYMYYGNAGASAGSSGSDTFILFEDFNALTDGDLNGQNSWSGSANFDVQTSVKYEGAKALEITTGGSTINIKKAVSVTSYNCFVQAMMRSNDVSKANILAIYANEGAHGISAIYLGQDRFNHFTAGGWQSTNIPAINNTWFKARLAFDSASTHKVWINDQLATPAANTNNTNVTSSIDSIQIEQYTDTTATGYLDTIFVGQYLSTGPTLGTFGAEESK